MMNKSPGKQPPITISRYYGLRFISAIYKFLAVLTVIVVVGAIGYLGAQYLGIPYPVRVNAPTTPDFVVSVLSILIGGGILALTFYVLGQLIEIQLSMNDKMRQLVEHFQRQERTLNRLETLDKKTSEIIERLQSAMPLMERRVRLSQAPESKKSLEQLDQETENPQ